MDKFTIPEQVRVFLQEFVLKFQEYFGQRLVGIYLHGSLAMGCFNPVSSDIDILVVVNKPLAVNDRYHIGQILLEMAKTAPANGLEMSIVTLQSLQDFQYPTPYELHFSNGNRADYAAGTVDLVTQKFDPDLAAHFVITKTRGVRLFGEPIDSIFPEIPAAIYLDSIADDSDQSFTNIMNGLADGDCFVPVYAVLNFCRVLAFIEHRLITSKLEGGEWGLKHLPVQYKPIIQEALRQYGSCTSNHPIPCNLLQEFAVYAKARIDHGRKSQS